MKLELRRNKISSILLASFLIVIITACENPFQFSMYDANTSDSGINQKNIDRITNYKDKNDTLTIATFADSHNYYEDLRKAISLINSMQKIDFVIVAGDITETGLFQQYETYLKEISKLKIPYITVIGNHDYLSNGSTIYKKMFGPINFFFEYSGYRFVGFNDNVWENSNTPPDFEWLNQVLHNGSRKSILVAHIQPWTDDQLGEKYSLAYEASAKAGNVILSIGGHSHGFLHSIKDNIHYLIAGSVTTGGISIVNIYNDEVSIERINF